MPEPIKPPSKLDSAQVLQHAFDDETKTLRVQTEATVVAGVMEVAIDHQTDSVKIGDGTRLAGVTSNNELKVKLASVSEASPLPVDLSNVTVDNTLRVSGGLVKPQFDYFSGAHTSTSSVYTYRMGGPTGTIVSVVTVTYVDGTKREIASLTVT
jgi:hypothetical protein